MSNNRPTGSLTASLRKAKERDTAGSLGKLRIVRSIKQASKYVFPKPSTVPAGQYASKIVDILEATTKQGDPAVDVHYDIHSGTNHYHVKLRYPIDSSYFGDLCDALIDAGIPEEANIKKGIGVEETIKLDYPNGATIGSIVSRSPITATANKAVDDEGNDDLLLDDDDLYED